MMMKKLLIAFSAVMFSAVVNAAGSGYPLMPFASNMDDKASLQRGAALFFNYCSGCHTTQYQRHERTADDLGIPHDVYLDNLVFDPGSKIGNLMNTGMEPKAAKKWFGAAPPDLTMVARAKGGDWVYTYLQTFYSDPSRPLGANNLVFPNVGMPNVLIGLQGDQELTCAEAPEILPNGDKHIDPLTGTPFMTEQCNVLKVKEGTGTMSAAEFETVAYDLTNYLSYIAEPAQIQRKSLGIWVLLFIAVFFVFAYALKKEYWRDVKH